MSKLKPCPFCGGKPSVQPVGEYECVTCSNQDCFMTGVGAVPEVWNTRPATTTEGELREVQLEQALLRMVQTFDHHKLPMNHRDLVEAKENALAHARAALRAKPAHAEGE